MNVKAGGGMSQSQTPGSINGTIWGQTCYGDAVPYLFGRSRIPPKLIWAANHRKFKSGKKLKQSKKKGSQPQYEQNVDFLLASTTLQDVLSIWRNRDIFAVSTSSETGTVNGSGDYTLTSVPGGKKAIAILGVRQSLPYSVTFNDYGGAGVRTLGGTTLLPIYRKESLVAPVFAYSTSNFPYPKIYSIAPFSPSTPKIHFPDASMIGATIVVFYAYADPAKFPLSLLNLQFEPALADGTEYAPAPSQQLPYQDVAGVGSDGLDLGTADSIPSLTMETTGNYALTEFGECNPADILQGLFTIGQDPTHAYQNLLALQDSFYRSAGTTAFTTTSPPILGDLTNLRNFCQANGIYLSMYMDTQKNASEWVQEILDAANAEAVMNGFTLDIIPRSEVSAFGDGLQYDAPTATGPIIDLTPRVMVQQKGGSYVRIQRVPQIDAKNIVPIQHIDSQNSYSTMETPWQDVGDIYLRGAYKDTVKTMKSIHRITVAQQVASMMVSRNTHLLRPFFFTLQANVGSLFTPMDLVTIQDPTIGLASTPVRIMKVTENENGEFEIEAEDFRYGVNSPTANNAAAASNVAKTTNAEPGNVQDTFIFNVPSRLHQTPAALELGIACCSPNVNWGGAVVMASDDNITYEIVGTIQGNPTMGRTTANYPSHADPDNTDTLSVDLAESLGTIEAATTQQQNAFASLVGLNGVNGFEVVGYAAVSFVTGNQYNLTQPIRRGQLGTAPIASPTNSQFLLLDSSVLHFAVDPSWIGKTLYFKFLSFNTYGQEQQALADVSPVTYSPTGAGVPNVSYSINPTVVLSQGTGANTNKITTAAFTATFPTGTVSYLGNTGTIPTPLVNTDYWVTITDPAQVGEGGGNPALTYNYDTTPTRANSGGFTYCGKITVTAAGGATGGAGGSAGPR